LRRQVQRLNERRENKIEDISFTVSRLTILQNVYYELEEEEFAELLAIEINLITEGRLELPESIEESRQQMRRFGLEI
ncbi:MAG: hypothetical protein EA390_00415, partial [Balneolaceae bacterium]